MTNILGSRLFISCSLALALTGLSTPVLSASQASFSMVNGFYSVNPLHNAMVQFFSSTDPSIQRCEGSLISPEWVLTAGHCVSDYKSTIAITDEARENPAKRVKPKEVVLHPLFKKPEWGTTIGQWDVALVRLPHRVYDKPTVTLSTRQSPLQPTLSDQLMSDDPSEPIGAYQDASRKVSATIIGYGSLGIGNEFSTIPREVDLHAVPQTICAHEWNSTVDAIRGYQCVAGNKPRPGRSTALSCQGDSGAALLTRTTSGRYIQTGVLSSGSATCDDTKPTVFTDVSMLRGWIARATSNAVPADATSPGEFASVPQRHINADTPESIAAEVSNYSFPFLSESAVLASASSWADSLTGAGYAAGKYPFFFTDSNELSPLTKTTLQHFVKRGGEIVILGGSKAVSRTVEAQLHEIGYGTSRLYGSTREGTAVSIARGMVERFTNKNNISVMIASRNNWADAVAGGYLSSFGQVPVLLSGVDSLDERTLDFLTGYSVANITILGGTNVISEKVVEQITKTTGIVPVRLSGATRVQTAAKIAEYAKNVYGNAGYNVDTIVAYDAYAPNGWAQSLATSAFNAYGPTIGMGVNVDAISKEIASDPTKTIFKEKTPEFQAFCNNRQIRLWTVGPKLRTVSNQIGSTVIKSCE